MLVEDNPADQDLFQELLPVLKSEVELYIVESGREAISYLRCLPPYETVEQPDITVLDLDLPDGSGHRVLAEIRSDPGLVNALVVIFSSSTSQADIDRCKEVGASAYFPKPISIKEYRKSILGIEQFWIDNNEAVE